MGTWRTVSRIEHIPDKPGCYALYVDGRLIYIGSSNRLANRIASHLYSRNHDGAKAGPKIPEDLNGLTVKIAVSSRMGEWLTREYRLIRRLQPRDNKKIGSARILLPFTPFSGNVLSHEGDRSSRTVGRTGAGNWESGRGSETAGDLSTVFVRHLGETADDFDIDPLEIESGKSRREEEGDGVNIYELSCKRCGHVWYPRTPEPPKICPECKSEQYRVPRQGKALKVQA